MIKFFFLPLGILVRRVVLPGIASHLFSSSALSPPTRQSLFPHTFCDTPIPPTAPGQGGQEGGSELRLGMRLTWVWFSGESFKGASASLLNLSESWLHQLSSGDKKI